MPDKKYLGKHNREFLFLNEIENGIRYLKGHKRKETVGTKLTEYETARNKAISKVRHIVEKYYGLIHSYNKACRARFPKMFKNAMDSLFRQFTLNFMRGTKAIKPA